MVLCRLRPEGPLDNWRSFIPEVRADLSVKKLTAWRLCKIMKLETVRQDAAGQQTDKVSNYGNRKINTRCVASTVRMAQSPQ
jgi:hypothetical protein